MTTEPSDGHEPEDPAEAPVAPGGLSSGQKIVIAVAGALVLVAGGVLIGSQLGSDDEVIDEPTAEAPVVPGEQEPAAVPAEAQGFVDSYGERYAEPVATYYAEQQYKAEDGGLASTLDNEWVSAYVFDNSTTTPESPLYDIGFVRLPLETQINSTTMVDVLNNQEVANGINRYMNLIARNTSPEAVAVIDNEFLKYMGRDNANSANLLATLKSVVSQYGSAANYGLAPAVAVDYQTDDPEHTTVLTNSYRCLLLTTYPMRDLCEPSIIQLTYVLISRVSTQKAIDRLRP